MIEIAPYPITTPKATKANQKNQPLRRSFAAHAKNHPIDHAAPEARKITARGIKTSKN
jgi:hypothetical protein